MDHEEKYGKPYRALSTPMSAYGGIVTAGAAAELLSVGRSIESLDSREIFPTSVFWRPPPRLLRFFSIKSKTPLAQIPYVFTLSRSFFLSFSLPGPGICLKSMSNAHTASYVSHERRECVLTSTPGVPHASVYVWAPPVPYALAEGFRVRIYGVCRGDV